jgi:hypothetical protein
MVSNKKGTHPMSKKLGSLFLALLILGVLGGILPTSYANRSAIQRLNVQRLPKPNQLYLPNAFYRDKVNSVTVKANPGEQVVLYYRYLPSGDQTLPADKLIIQIPPTQNVQQVQIPLPSTEVFKEIPASSPFKKGKEVTPIYQFNAIQIEAVRIDADGRVIEKIQNVDASGLAGGQDVIPLLEPYVSTHASVMPSVQGLDHNTMRSVQSMIDLAGDEEKRKRLLYDGTINRDRSLDRNTFIDGGAKTSIPGHPTH